MLILPEISEEPNNFIVQILKYKSVNLSVINMTGAKVVYSCIRETPDRPRTEVFERKMSPSQRFSSDNITCILLLTKMRQKNIFYKLTKFPHLISLSAS